MDFVFDFVYVGDGDAIIVWARNPNDFDLVLFIDGGNSGNSKQIITHYETFIKPYLQNKYYVGFVNTHPHEDHINGLIELLENIDEKFSFAIYNDPVECISLEHRDKIKAAYLRNEDDDITHLYKTFEQVEWLNNFCEEKKIKRYRSYNDLTLSVWLNILSPSEDFYVNMVQYFADIDFLKKVKFSQKKYAPNNYYQEVFNPCGVVDEVDDTSPENLTSIVLKFTDSSGRNYILTGDAGRATFDDIKRNDLVPENIKLMQLPHHGSRRNISSGWICEFAPSYFFVSAAGNEKHPRQALITCIKNNLKSCGIYSTHLNKGALSHTTNPSVFPNRNWGSATAL